MKNSLLRGKIWAHDLLVMSLLPYHKATATWPSFIVLCSWATNHLQNILLLRTVVSLLIFFKYSEYSGAQTILLLSTFNIFQVLRICWRFLGRDHGRTWTEGRRVVPQSDWPDRWKFLLDWPQRYRSWRKVCLDDEWKTCWVYTLVGWRP